MTADSGADVKYRQALAHLQAGRAGEAAALLHEIVAQRPDHFDALHMLGAAQIQIGHVQEALHSLDRAVKVNPRNPFVYYNRGMALRALKRPEEALASFNRALALKPDFAEAHNSRGISLRDLVRTEEAKASYQRALALMPDNVQALNNLGNIYRDLECYDESLACFDRALVLKPDYANVHITRGALLHTMQRFEESLASFDRALRLVPSPEDAYKIYNQKGLVLQKLNRPEEAVSCFDRALMLKPDSVGALSNRGIALLASNRCEDALASCTRAQALKPGDVDAHWNEALCRLVMGDFRRGWEQYEWRWKMPDFERDRRVFKQPLWLGREDIAGKTILLWPEQGLGDTLQFCRYAEAVAPRGATVWLGVPGPLKSLLSRLKGPSRVFGPGETPSGYDYHCPLLSLPLACGTTLDTIPAAVPYLSADPAKVVQWQARLGSPDGRRRVGLLWSGNAGHINDHNRSIPLAALTVLARPGVRFIGLQKEVRDADRPALARFPNLEQYGETLGDFDDTAALIACLDVVITVDTAVAHLAGALGKPVWILLPYAPDWRWLLERSDSPWYPTARLFRQTKIGDWNAVLRQVTEALDALPRH